ncbi:hypothetical protein ASPCADRAFT_209559 [Aspergillus carbonarius ITEM 5010]|uniref:Uncharacterized protein n=1 Tax=Aspergillus carbonarius (strain ITEM 5010) TaxID=602072 RepID=A0A1R3RGK5_ASPC5|nr:hypothetical protein ASPCADRAFT_209559 [Aspergillus carbonarius ITEM 5010]
MQFKSLFLALALSASAQAWIIHSYTEKDCKGTADTAAQDGNLETCINFGSTSYKSLKAQPGDYVLTAFAETGCAGTGYALQPGKCINTDPVVSYERQFIAITKRDNATLLEDYADYFAEFPEEIDEFR